ncbi:hypothetical protein D9M68_733500 [compost metagenome]
MESVIGTGQCHLIDIAALRGDAIRELLAAGRVDAEASVGFGDGTRLLQLRQQPAYLGLVQAKRFCDDGRSYTPLQSNQL